MDEPDAIEVRWPVGPIVVADGRVGPRAWVEYKLASASWYINTLEALGEEFDFGRLFGVEMALDGALAALCGAVDAAERPVVLAGWAMHGRPKGRKSYPHSSDFMHLQNYPDPLGSVSRGVVAAERKTQTEAGAIGWVAALRELRNQATHQDTLTRFIHDTSGVESLAATGLSLPGTDTRIDPIAYLRDCERGVRDLVEQLLGLLAEIGPEPDPPQDRRSVTIRAPVAVMKLQTPAPPFTSGTAEPSPHGRGSTSP